MKNSLTLKTSVFILTGFLLSPVVQAENKALERAQYMLRQLNSQKVQLEKKNVSLTAELDALRKESENKLKKQKAETKKQQSVNKRLGASGKKKDKYIASLREKLKQTVAALRLSEQQRLQANTTGQALDVEMKQCVDNNSKLVQMNDSLIDKYGKKGCWDTIVQNEPFTGINQVEIENILQEYRFTNEDYEVEQKTEYEQYGDSVSTAPKDDSFGG